MTVQRPVQGSFIPDMERPVGPILLSVFTGTNAELMAAVAPLYLTGSVLDPTYGEGKWWEKVRPDPFAFHDLKLDAVDFRALPEDDQTFDSVVFDPPYTISGGKSGAALYHNHAGAGSRPVGFQERYGLGVRNLDEPLDSLIRKGLAECCRVARQWVLVKCMEFAQGGGPTGFHDTPTMVTNEAAERGWYKHDQIVHYTGTGPGGHNIFTVKRARRAHSYLVVFSRGGTTAAPPSVTGTEEAEA